MMDGKDFTLNTDRSILKWMSARIVRKRVIEEKLFQIGQK